MPKITFPKFNLKSKKHFDKLLEINSGKIDKRFGRCNTSSKVTLLRLQYESLLALREFVDNEENRNHLRELHINARQAGIAIDKNMKQVVEAHGDMEESWIAQKNFVTRVIIPTDDGEYAGNGKCYIQFVNMGMGDCSLITTPSGKTIMVDLGTASTSDIEIDKLKGTTIEEIIRSNINSQLFLNNSSTIDILLLTHPDEDHYNKLEIILKGYVQRINKVYYGGTDKFENYYPQSQFICELTGGYTAKFVELREMEKKVNNNIVVTRRLNNDVLSNTGTPNEIGYEYVDANTGEIVLYYEMANDEVVFKLSILAANVKGVWLGSKFINNDAAIKGLKEMKQNGTRNNKRSLVISVECYGRRILIMGDATAITEQFVVNHYPEILKKVDTLRFGHHGSPTSSCRAFVRSLPQLKRAVGSTGGKNTTKHSLPKMGILREYIDKDLAAAGDHFIYGFEKDNPVVQILDVKKGLFTTGSNGTIQFAETGNTSRVKIDNTIIFEQTYDHNS